MKATKEVKAANAEIITLPEEPQFKRGDLVEVSDNKRHWHEAIYLTEIKGVNNLPYIVVHHSDNERFYEGKYFDWVTYEYIRPIQKQETYTIDEVLKKAGLDPSKVKIVNG